MTNIETVKKRAENDAKNYGCYLTPDQGLLNDLLEGLLTNEKRYGYPICPCRLASGNLELDRDIICPCDYRDPDLDEYGQCYCGLYVNKDVQEGKTEITPIPERRPQEKQGRAYSISTEQASAPEGISTSTELKTKLYYCKQCGYVCYREDAPYTCPICKAKKEMFTELSVITKITG